jgi:hypothetical protein
MDVGHHPMCIIFSDEAIVTMAIFLDGYDHLRETQSLPDRTEPDWTKPIRMTFSRTSRSPYVPARSQSRRPAAQTPSICSRSHSRVSAWPPALKQSIFTAPQANSSRTRI